MDVRHISRQRLVVRIDHAPYEAVQAVLVTSHELVESAAITPLTQVLVLAIRHPGLRHAGIRRPLPTATSAAIVATNTEACS